MKTKPVSEPKYDELGTLICICGAYPFLIHPDKFMLCQVCGRKYKIVLVEDGDNA